MSLDIDGKVTVDFCGNLEIDMNGRSRRFIIGAMLLTFLNANSQVEHKPAYGISAGYRVNSGSFFIDYNLSAKWTLTNEYGLDVYQGLGIGLGTTYYPIKTSRVKPLIGISYLVTFGSSFSFDRGNDVITVFKTSPANYIVPVVGVRYNGLGEDKINGVSFSIVLKVGYKISNLVSPVASYVSGPPYPDKQSQLNVYVDNGIVGSVGLILNISKKGKNG